MLYINTANNELVWHVGDNKPTSIIPEIVSIQADSDELELILSVCKNIPTNNKRVVTWYGDIAKFIIKSIF